MRYKGEVYIGGNLVASSVMTATHPTQVARRMTQEIKKKDNSAIAMIVYIANERGELWLNSVKKIDGVYNIKQLPMNIPPLNSNEVEMAFLMNQPLKNFR